MTAGRVGLAPPSFVRWAKAHPTSREILDTVRDYSIFEFIIGDVLCIRREIKNMG